LIETKPMNDEIVKKTNLPKPSKILKKIAIKRIETKFIDENINCGWNWK